MRTFLYAITTALVWAAGESAGRAQWLASKLNTHEVFAYDETSGQRIGAGAFVAAGAGGLNQPHGIWHRGADFLVASFGDGTVKRFDRVSGQYLGNFLTAAQGLNQPTALKVGRDTWLYLSSQGNHRILRFHAVTGTSPDGAAFIEGGLLNGPSGFDWSPDGTILYVAGRYSGNVLAYQASTGAPLPNGHAFATGLGLGTTFGLAVAPNGDVFVATSNTVRRYASTGVLLATIALASIGLELTADGTGVLAASGGSLRRIDLANDAVAPAFLSPNIGGTLNFFFRPTPLVGPRFLEVVSANQRYQSVEFQVTKWSPGITSWKFSPDLTAWQDAVTYTPTGLTVTRSGNLTQQHRLIDQGDKILVIERDTQPIGSLTRRFYRLPGASP